MPKPQKSIGYPSAPHCSSFIAPNEVVGVDGVKFGVRENEDRVFHCMSFDNKAELYMVLDGHDGTNACDFVKEFLPGELFNQLGGTQGKPEEVQRAIWDTFLETEKRYFLSMDHILTQKLTLQFELGEMTASDAAKRYPSKVEQIEQLNRQIRGGTSVVMALLFHGYLYVANVGDSRAVLCQQQDVLRVRQLSDDHTLHNDREVARLVALGLSRNWLLQRGRLGPCDITRCIGDYWIKGGYTEMVEIKGATREPGTAEPYIAPPLALHEISKGFLFLMSDGLYKAYQCRFLPEHLSHLVALEMKWLHPNDFVNLAKNVTNAVRATFRNHCKEKGITETTDDMSVVVRNLGFDMGTEQQYLRTMSVQPGHRGAMGMPAVTPTTAPILSNDNPQFWWGSGNGSFGPLPLPPANTPTTRRHPAAPDPSLGSPQSMHLSSSLSSLQLGEAMYTNSAMMFESSTAAQLRGMGMGHQVHNSSFGWPPYPFAPVGESHHVGGSHVLHPPPPPPSHNPPVPPSSNPPVVNVSTPGHSNTPVANVTHKSPGSVVVGSPLPVRNPPMTSKALVPEVQTTGDQLSHSYDSKTLTKQDYAGRESPQHNGGDDDHGDGGEAASGVIVIESDVPEESNDGKIKPYISFDTIIPADLSFDML